MNSAPTRRRFIQGAAVAASAVAASQGISHFSETVTAEELDEDVIIAGDYTTQIFAIGVSSEELIWEYNIDIDGNGFEGSPIVADGFVIIPCVDNIYYAVDIETGELEWEYEVKNYPSDPVVVDDTLYLGLEGTIHAVDVNHGEKQWDKYNSDGVFFTPHVSDGVVYVGASGVNGHSGTLHALDADSGNEQWVFTHDSSLGVAPTVRDGVVYTASDSGVLLALDAADGSVEWEFSEPTAHIPAPVVTEDTVYASCENGSLYAVGVGTGDLIWEYEASEFREAPTVGADTVFAGGDGTFHAIDAGSGDELWTDDQFDWNIETTPTVAAETVFAIPPNDTVVAWDVQTGDVLWELDTDFSRVSPTYVFAGDRYSGGSRARLETLGHHDHVFDSPEHFAFEEDTYQVPEDGSTHVDVKIKAGDDWDFDGQVELFVSGIEDSVKSVTIAVGETETVTFQIDGQDYTPGKYNMTVEIPGGKDESILEITKETSDDDGFFSAINPFSSDDNENCGFDILWFEFDGWPFC